MDLTEAGEVIGKTHGSGSKYVAESTELGCDQWTGNKAAGRTFHGKCKKAVKHRVWSDSDGTHHITCMHLTEHWL